MSTGRIVVVVGPPTDLRREGGAAAVLRSLGAQVRALEPFEDADEIIAADPGGRSLRAIVVEAPERPDLAVRALRHLRRQPAMANCGALAAVSPAQVAQLDPAGGFDDFVLVPYLPAELYARLRAVEWRRSEFANEERIKLGRLLIDRAGHEVVLDGAALALTAREFALLVYLCERRGRAVARREALARVWPDSYEGGARTVDIHIRRLRHKLGDALPLQTIRGVGYKLALPSGADAAAGEAPTVLLACGSSSTAATSAPVEQVCTSRARRRPAQLATLDARGRG